MTINSLIARDPFFSDLPLALRNAIDANKGVESNLFNSKPTYPVDAYFTPETFVVEVPIVDALVEDVDISYTGNTVTINYKRSNKPNTEGRDYIRRFITKKDFSLAIPLSSNFDLTKIESKYSNGLLTVTVPMAQKVPVPVEKVQVEVKQ
jgi:HSP20 family molecular chaperone IbpA